MLTIAGGIVLGVFLLFLAVLAIGGLMVAWQSFVEYLKRPSPAKREQWKRDALIERY